MVLFPLLLVLGAPLPTGTAAPEPLQPGWIAWQDAGRPRAARRLEASAITGRTRVEVRERDRGRTFTAEVDGHAIVRSAGALDAQTLRSMGLRPVRVLLDAPGVRLSLVASVAGEDGLSIAARLAERLDVMPDLWLHHVSWSGQSSFDDPLLMAQWYVRRMGLEAAWSLEAGDPSVRIAINDNGCDLSHADLRDELDPGRDVIDGDDDPSFAPGAPGNEHGTACAGLVGATGNNGTGIVGTCPGCRMRCVRLLPPGDGLVPLSADVEAFDFGRVQGVAVSSNSWGFAQRMAAPGPVRVAITAFVDDGRDGKGGLVVFAAGNDNRLLDDDEITGIDGVITVAAVNNFDEPTSFTNSGRSVDLAAPTGSFTTDVTGAEGNGPEDYTSHFGGTSSACPLVAGVLGLLVSAAPEATGAELAMALRLSLRPAPFATPGPDGHDLEHGYGLVDPAAALALFVVAEPPDAGVVLDAAADAAVPRADAGVEPDQGVEPAVEASSCDCHSARGSSAAPLALLLLAAYLRSRRWSARQPRSSPPLQDC